MLGGAFWRVICYWRHIDTYIEKNLSPLPFDQKGRPLNQMIGLAVRQGDVK